MSVGFGPVVMMSSYNNFRHDVYRDAAIISITDALTSLLAGFTVFSTMGHLAYQLGQNIEDVVTAGTTLAFISYPDVLARFNVMPQQFSVIFFLMLFTLGVGSASANVGSVTTVICDDFPALKKPLVTLVISCSGLLLGLFYVTPQGQYILTLVDHYFGVIYKIFYIFI